MRAGAFPPAAAEQHPVAELTTSRSTSTCSGAGTLRTRMRPLVVMTPKSLLRHPLAQSSLADMATGRFQKVLDDACVMERREHCEADSLQREDLLRPASRGRKNGRRAAGDRADRAQLYTFPEEEPQDRRQVPELHRGYMGPGRAAQYGRLDYLDEKLFALLGERITPAVQMRDGPSAPHLRRDTLLLTPQSRQGWWLKRSRANRIADCRLPIADFRWTRN